MSGFDETTRMHESIALAADVAATSFWQGGLRLCFVAVSSGCAVRGVPSRILPFRSP